MFKHNIICKKITYNMSMKKDHAITSPRDCKENLISLDNKEILSQFSSADGNGEDREVNDVESIAREVFGVIIEDQSIFGDDLSDFSNTGKRVSKIIDAGIHAHNYVKHLEINTFKEFYKHLYRHIYNFLRIEGVKGIHRGSFALDNDRIFDDHDMPMGVSSSQSEESESQSEESESQSEESESQSEESESQSVESEPESAPETTKDPHPFGYETYPGELDYQAGKCKSWTDKGKHKGKHIVLTRVHAILGHVTNKNTGSLLRRIHDWAFTDIIVTTGDECNTMYRFRRESLLWEGSYSREVAQILSDILLNVVDCYRTYLIAGKLEAEDRNDKNRVEECEIIIKKCEQATTKLQSTAFIDKSFLQIKHTFYQADFDEKLSGSPHVLAVAKGKVIELNTGTLRDRKATDYATFEIPYVYNPDASTALFESFIDQITSQDNTFKNYLHKLLGYAITGLTNEKQFYVFYGENDSGKTTLMSCLELLLGRYYLTANNSIFLDQGGNRGGGPSPELVQLRGKRVVLGTEFKEGQKFDQSTIKRFVGKGDSINARECNRNNITFVPTFKLFITTNNIPETTGDPTFLVKMVLLPFKSKFVDPSLVDESKHWYPINKNFDTQVMRKPSFIESMFKWIVTGAVRYYQEGLGNPPATFQEVMDDYVNSNISPVSYFISDILEGNVVFLGNEVQYRPRKGDYAISNSVLYNAYLDQRSSPRYKLLYPPHKYPTKAGTKQFKIELSRIKQDGFFYKHRSIDVNGKSGKFQIFSNVEIDHVADI